MLPVQCQGLHYPPHMLSVVLLIAYHHWLEHGDHREHRRCNSRATGHASSTLVSAANTDRHKCIKLEEMETRAAQATAYKSRAPAPGNTRSLQLPHPVAPGCNTFGVREPQNIDKHISSTQKAVCEGRETMWSKPGPHVILGVSEAQKPAASEITTSDTRHDRSFFENRKSSSVDRLQQCTARRPASAQTSSMLAAFLNARDRVNDEMQILHVAKHTTTQAPEKILSGLLRAFAADVLCSKHAPANAPTSDAQSQYARHETMENQGASHTRCLVTRGIRHVLDDVEPCISTHGSLCPHIESDSAVKQEMERQETDPIPCDSDLIGTNPTTLGHRGTIRILPHVIAWHSVRLLHDFEISPSREQLHHATNRSQLQFEEKYIRSVCQRLATRISQIWGLICSTIRTAKGADTPDVPQSRILGRIHAFCRFFQKIHVHRSRIQPMEDLGNRRAPEQPSTENACNTKYTTLGCAGPGTQAQDMPIQVSSVLSHVHTSLSLLDKSVSDSIHPNAENGPERSS